MDHHIGLQIEQHVAVVQGSCGMGTTWNKKSYRTI